MMYMCVCMCVYHVHCVHAHSQEVWRGGVGGEGGSINRTVGLLKAFINSHIRGPTHLSKYEMREPCHLWACNCRYHN